MAKSKKPKIGTPEDLVPGDSKPKVFNIELDSDTYKNLTILGALEGLKIKPYCEKVLKAHSEANTVTVVKKDTGK